jgi:hypothetical protein
MHGDTVNMISYIQASPLMNRGLIGGGAKHHTNFIFFLYLLKIFSSKFTWFSIVLHSFLRHDLICIKRLEKK